ncbi:hypothetical protein FIBSPDRAFT_521946 [Athelia psychrophila]|uniref:Uncharacterized protein n=1 Tax=Athelia psychrophila TaxID=1759441 RepID=A0A167TL05_9AGAM|nr:hypothetical protein FIBSPDRAFT_521946 [Fibularhizoctonia sp. CBS 109695]
MAETAGDPYLLVEKCGSNRGIPIFVITKYTPSPGRASRTREIRCQDLGEEAMGSYKAQQGGCSYIQFKNEKDDFRCSGCGQDFSKKYLRQSALIEVRDLPL